MKLVHKMGRFWNPNLHKMLAAAVSSRTIWTLENSFEVRPRTARTFLSPEIARLFICLYFLTKGITNLCQFIKDWKDKFGTFNVHSFEIFFRSECFVNSSIKFHRTLLFLLSFENLFNPLWYFVPFWFMHLIHRIS